MKQNHWYVQETEPVIHSEFACFYRSKCKVSWRNAIVLWKNAEFILGKRKLNFCKWTQRILGEMQYFCKSMKSVLNYIAGYSLDSPCIYLAYSNTNVLQILHLRFRSWRLLSSCLKPHRFSHKPCNICRQTSGTGLKGRSTRCVSVFLDILDLSKILCTNF